MASISDIVLFVSSTSNASAQVIQYVQQNPIKMTVVRLDTAEDRERAKNGGLFKITQVPTMVLFLTDGRVWPFVGVPKITQWMAEALGRAGQSQQQPHPQLIEQHYPRQDPSQYPSRGKSLPSSIEEEEDDEDVFYETSKKPKKKPIKKKVPVPQPKKRPPKKKPVKRRPAEDEELVFMGEEDESPPPRQPSGLALGGSSNADRKKSSISNVMEAAAAMKAQRDSTLDQYESRYQR